jgi:hypothetical protein
MKPMKVVAAIAVGMALLAAAAVLFSGGWSWVKTVVTQDDRPNCSAGRFQIESHSGRTESRRLIVTAKVRNNNAIACGVQVTVALKDTGGRQVAIEQLWVAGVSNIPAGATHDFPIYFSPEVSSQAAGGAYDIKPIKCQDLASAVSRLGRSLQ